MTTNRRHPPGLYVLFFTEMWERFSYYGMRSLLVYYMIKHLQFTQERSSQIYGLYTGFVYFTPLFGGMLADRLLGQRRTVIVGAVLMAMGHFLMASEATVLSGPRFSDPWQRRFQAEHLYPGRGAVPSRRPPP